MPRPSNPLRTPKHTTTQTQTHIYPYDPPPPVLAIPVNPLNPNCMKSRKMMSQPAPNQLIGYIHSQQRRLQCALKQREKKKRIHIPKVEEEEKKRKKSSLESVPRIREMPLSGYIIWCTRWLWVLSSPCWSCCSCSCSWGCRDPAAAYHR